MLEAVERISPDEIDDLTKAQTVTLNFDIRQKSRFKSRTDEGNDVGFFLARGQVLRHGDLIQTHCGEIIRVVSAEEDVISASCDDPHLFARACYHLGNRHVPLQIGQQWLRIQPDHVLEEMLTQLGLTTELTKAPFEPESGAYQGHSHHHH